VHIRPQPDPPATTAAAVRVGKFGFRGVETWTPDVEHDATGAWAGSYLTWTTPQLPEFTERKITVELDADQPIDWRGLVTEVKCREKTEER
jgi:hypothetical protein